MRATRGLGGLAAALAVTAPAAAPALGAHHRRLPNNEALQATGSIVYTWHGDPARGCATESLCQVDGTLVMGGSHGVVLSGGLLQLFQTGTIRVSDRAGAGECVDTPRDPVAVLLLRRTGESFRASPLGSLGGRCAEPLSRELGAIPIPVRLEGSRRHPTVDLRFSKAFTAGPFSGALRSTLVLRPAPSAGGGGFSGGSFSTSSSGTGTSRSGKTRPVLAEFVNLVFRIAALPSSLGYTFGGESDPFCQVLDSCGTSGSLALSAGGSDLRLALNAVRRVPERVSPSRALADFRRGRLPFGFPGAVTLQSLTREQLQRPDGSTCQDTSTSQLQLVLGSFSPISGSPKAGPLIPVTIPGSGQSADVLRTHCPGPLDSDVLPSSQNPSYARGVVAASALLGRRVTLSLSAPGLFEGLGYSGSRGGTLRFELTRVSLHAGTEGGA